MPGSSTASLMKRCQDDQSSSVRRFVLVGSPMTSIIATSFYASARCLVTRPLQGGSYLLLNVITKMRITPHKYLVKCTPESGGGQCRYIQISPHIVDCILTLFLAIP